MRTDAAPPLSASMLQAWPARVETATHVEPKSKGAELAEDDARRRRESAAERRAQERPLVSGRLRIEYDDESGRFVQTLTDAETQEVLRRFPHESQLAFARAVRAYAEALIRR